MEKVKHRILIIDDQQEICEYISEVARLVEHEPRYLTNTHFLDEALQFDPTLIMLDLIMPNLDGIETLRYLAKNKCAAGIILTSGFDKRVLRTASRLAEQLGLNLIGNITKPIHTKDLIKIFKEHTSLRENSVKAAHNISEAQLLEAIKNRQFVAYLQPKVRLDDMQVYSVETLVRWHHPEYGVIEPADFIYLAEKTGHIAEITWQMIQQAFDFKKSLGQTSQHLSISINIPLSMIVNVDFTDRFVSEIIRNKIEPSHIIVEITESAINRQIATSLDVLTRLRMKGTLLSIDDFGTGYSSLERLNNIPFTELKLDRSFIRDIEDDSSRKIVQKSIELAHELGIEVVAEGVESKHTVRTLQKMGCNAAQGYYYAHPMPGDHFRKWLSAYQLTSNIHNSVNSAL